MFDAAAIAHLAQLPRLAGLHINGATDACIEAIARCLPSLQLLDIDSSRGVSAAGLAPLSQLTALTRFDANHIGITDDGVAQVAGLPALRQLGMNCGRMLNLGVAHLTALNALTRLNLRQCRNVDDVQPLSQLVSLQHLDLYGTSVTLDGDGNVSDCLAHISNLSALTTLILSNTEIPSLKDKDLLHLSALTLLRHLDLARISIMYVSSKRLFAALTNLERLSQSNSDTVDNYTLGHLLTCSNLRDLDISCCRKVSDDGMAHMPKLPVLEVLNVSHCDVGDAALRHLRSCTRLQRLDLSSCVRITHAGLHDLRPLSALQHLCLNGCVRVTGEDLEVISHVPNLQTDGYFRGI